MTIRGKNLMFLGSVLSSLDLQESFKKGTFAHFKQSVTPEVVEEAFSLISMLWPDLDDFERAIERNAIK